MRRLLVLLLLCLSCSYIMDRDPWDGARYKPLRFDGGTLMVSTGECSPVDFPVLIDWANRAYRDMSAAQPGFDFTIDQIYVYGQKLSTRHGYYDTKDKVIVFDCGEENVIRHELFHRYCYRWKMGCNCATIDHPGGTPIGECKRWA